MEKFILILTNSEDESVARILVELEKLEVSYFRFNTETFPMETAITIADTSLYQNGYLRAKEIQFALEQIQSVWYRRPVPPSLPESMPEGYAKFINRESQTALWSFYTTLPAFWMNPPIPAGPILEHNKLYQTKIARQIGFRVPDTIITNNPEDLLQFTTLHGNSVAVKMLRGGFFVKEGSIEPHFIFTQRISRAMLEDHINDIRVCPILAQEYIEKALELRVTVVGERIFSCAIHSQDSKYTRHDWRRYDFENVKHEPFTLPQDVREKLLRFLRALELVYGAVDLVLTPEGEFVFLEINPSGQWGWIEDLTGMPISRAMAELLAYPPSH